jgi:putative hydrolase of the HAD superfamily
MRAARERTAALYPQMQHDFTFLRLQTLRDHAREFGYLEAMAEEAFDVFIRARNEVELYADVLPALAVLKPRYRLFTASNGNADLEKIGLAPYFERTLAARHVGALKPDPVMFHKVVEGTDLALHEVAYVGDDPHLDVEGARRAGMRAIWVNRTEAPWPESIEPPDWTIRTLTELVDGLGDS